MYDQITVACVYVFTITVISLQFEHEGDQDIDGNRCNWFPPYPHIK